MHLRDHWQLNPNIHFLNHGSFGACPRIVLKAQRDLRDQLEADPIRFLAPERELESKLTEVRHTLAEFIHAAPQDLAFVRNATDGVNAVMRSFPLQPNDEIVVTNHGYNACNNAARFACETAGARLKMAMVPFPLHSNAQILSAIESQLNSKTRLLMVDHVTSPTGLIFPVKQIVDLARHRGVRVLIDGAHAPGMLSLNLAELDADYYTGNHHKWLCAPKASGFLYVRRDLQPEVRPTVISHAANRVPPNQSRFQAEFDWNGTFDPTPLLSLPASLKFLETIGPGGLHGLQESNRQKALKSRHTLCNALQISPPASETMIGAMVSIPLPDIKLPNDCTQDSLQSYLRKKHQIEVPIFQLPDTNSTLIRVSLQAYNSVDQVKQLAAILKGLPTQ